MKRLIKTPKLHLGETGLACSLLGLDVEMLWKDRAVFGRLLETFIYQDLRRHASWHEETIIFNHFRDKDKVEIVVVLESGGRAASVEVKASETVTSDDSKGLRKLQDAVQERFAAGVVFMTVGQLCHLGAICMPSPYPVFGI